MRKPTFILVIVLLGSFSVADYTSAQETSKPLSSPFSPLDQEGYPLYPFSAEELPAVLTDEEAVLIKALFGGNAETSSLVRLSADSSGEVDTARDINLSQLPGLFSVFRGILVDVLCERVCSAGDSAQERLDKVYALMETQYSEENIKYFGYMSVDINVVAAKGTFTIYFDLNDMLSITSEGDDGWVTVWLDVGTGVGFSLGGFIPVGVGVIPFERISGSDDPSNRWSLSGLSLELPFYACNVATVDIGGGIDGSCDPTGEVALSVDAELIGVEVNLARFEVQREYLNRVMESFIESLPDTLLAPSIPTDLSQVVPRFVDFVFNFGLTGASLSITPGEGEIRAFTCLDDGSPCEQSGIFTVAAGCLDVNSDGVRDNICEINEDNTLEAEVEIAFTALSTGDGLCYKVEVEVPDGWDYERLYGIVGRPWRNCDTLVYGESVSKLWTFERTDPNSNEQAEVRLRLYSTRNPTPIFGGTGNLIDERLFTLIAGIDALLDVNGDGLITPADAIFATNQIGVQNSSADVNVDGVVDERDVNMIIAQFGTTR